MAPVARLDAPILAKMRSMWLPVVLGWIMSWLRDRLVLDRPWASRISTSTRGRSGPRGPHGGAARDGRRAASTASTAAASRRPARTSARTRRPPPAPDRRAGAPGLAHRLVASGAPSTRAGTGDRAARKSPRVSGYRPGALGAVRRSHQTAPGRRTTVEHSLGQVGYIRMRSHSPALSGPGRSQGSSSTRPAARSHVPARHAAASPPPREAAAEPVAGLRDRSATATEWPRVNGDFRSTKFAMAVSAPSS